MREQKEADVENVELAALDLEAAVAAVVRDAVEVHHLNAQEEREYKKELEQGMLSKADGTLAVALVRGGVRRSSDSVYDSTLRACRAFLKTFMSGVLGGLPGATIAKPEDVGAGVVLGSLYAGAVLQTLGNILPPEYAAVDASKQIAYAAFSDDSEQQDLEVGQRQYRQKFLKLRAIIQPQIGNILNNPNSVVVNGIPKFDDVPLDVLHTALSVRGGKSALSKGRGGGFLIGALGLASIGAAGVANYFAINAYDPDNNKGGAFGLKMLLLNVLTVAPCCMAAYKATKFTADSLDLRVFKEIIKNGESHPETGGMLKEAATDALTAVVLAKQMVLDFMQVVPENEVVSPDRPRGKNFFDEVIKKGVPVNLDSETRDALLAEQRRRDANAAMRRSPVIAQMPNQTGNANAAGGTGSFVARCGESDLERK